MEMALEQTYVDGPNEEADNAEDKKEPKGTQKKKKEQNRPGR